MTVDIRFVLIPPVCNRSDARKVCCIFSDWVKPTYGGDDRIAFLPSRPFEFLRESGDSSGHRDVSLAFALRIDTKPYPKTIELAFDPLRTYDFRCPPLFVLFRETFPGQGILEVVSKLTPSIYPIHSNVGANASCGSLVRANGTLCHEFSIEGKGLNVSEAMKPLWAKWKIVADLRLDGQMG